MHSNGVQCRVTDFGSREAILELEAYTLRAYSLGLRILDLGKQALDWGPTVPGQDFWMSGSNHWIGSLRSRAMEFETLEAIVGLGAYDLGACSLVL